MGDHIVIQTFHHFPGGQDIHPGGVGIDDHIGGSLVGLVDLGGQRAFHGGFHNVLQVFAELYRGMPVDLDGFAVLVYQGLIERGNTQVYDFQLLAHASSLRSNAFIMALARMVL